MSALGGSPVLPGDHGSPGNLDSLGLACTPTDADTREVESLGVDAHERGALYCLGWALHQLWPRELPASSLQAGAERAAAARPNALDPEAYGETGRGHKTPQ